jgi:hypothetical protein
MEEGEEAICFDSPEGLLSYVEQQEVTLFLTNWYL